MISQMEDNQPIKNERTVVQIPPPQNTVNSILIIAAAIIFVAVILSYFVEDFNIFAGLSIHEAASNLIWVGIGSFAISMIVKEISINRAKLTATYIKAKKETTDELDRYYKAGAFKYASDYCRDYEKRLLKDSRERILLPVGIEYDEFIEKYLAKSFLHIKKNYKDLSFKQVLAIAKANCVRQKYYNPDFLRTSARMIKNVAPSEMYNTSKKNNMNTAKSFILAIMGGLFAVTFGKDIVVSFTIKTLIKAVVKVAFIVMSVSASASFGWNLITITEVNNLNAKCFEAKECIKWSKERYPEYFANISINDEDEEKN